MLGLNFLVYPPLPALYPGPGDGRLRSLLATIPPLARKLSHFTCTRKLHSNLFCKIYFRKIKMSQSTLCNDLEADDIDFFKEEICRL
jgi:hypothetical protein